MRAMSSSEQCTSERSRKEGNVRTYAIAFVILVFHAFLSAQQSTLPLDSSSSCAPQQNETVLSCHWSGWISGPRWCTVNGTNYQAIPPTSCSSATCIRNPGACVNHRIVNMQTCCEPSVTASGMVCAATSPLFSQVTTIMGC